MYECREFVVQDSERDRKEFGMHREVRSAYKFIIMKPK